MGAAIALALYEAGCKVAVHGQTHGERLAAMAERVGGPALAGDVGAVNDARSLIEEAVDHLGRLDILVNNAGFVEPMSADVVSEENWERTLAVNLRGAFFAAQTAAVHMRQAKYGRIVNISSQGAEVAIDGYLSYGISKSGLDIMTKYLASEWASQGITVNCVAPAFVRTDLTAEVFRQRPSLYDDQIRRVPVRRMCEPEEVGAAVVYLASPDAAFVTGEVLHVDGGYLTE